MIWTGTGLAVLVIAFLAGVLTIGAGYGLGPDGPTTPATPAGDTGTPGLSQAGPPDASPVPIPSPYTLTTGPGSDQGSPAVTLPGVSAPVGPGATGPAVTAFQQRLAALSYMVNVNGTFDGAMGYAVTAFQKVEGLPRTGVVDSQTQAALERASAPTASYAAPPNHIEVDLARQVLLVVSGGTVAATLPVSTGSGEKFTEKDSPGTHVAVTPNGVFTVLWKYNGWWTSPLGQLYKPSFIDDTLGIAIHGYPSVPPEPASHGCIRIPLPFADAVYAHDTPVGMTVIVFGGRDGPNP